MILAAFFFSVAFSWLTQSCSLCAITRQDPTLEEGKGEVTEVAVRVRFDEDVNFEPPQGSLEVIEVIGASFQRVVHE